MRRLLQCGTVMLLIALFMPLQEVFDRWDMPGLSNDTEFALFAFALAICLVLLVGKLTAMGVLKVSMVSIRVLQRADSARHSEASTTIVFLVPPLSSIPLRI